MLRLDSKARVFVGSSSEGRPVAEKVAAALEAAGMRALLWCDFFLTDDSPLQELDRRTADADGAVLVGSADDHVQSRGEGSERMRDNVLFEYGLFAGHLGRHRCILLMPDQPRFRIPSDFLGVAGFEWYSDATLSDVLQAVPKRLAEGFAADAFHPPSLQERCRRMLLLAGWVRGEIAQLDLKGGRGILIRTLGERAESALVFLKEDIEALRLRAEVDTLCELVRDASNCFPDLPGRDEMVWSLCEHVEHFLRYSERAELPRRGDLDLQRAELQYLLGRHGLHIMNGCHDHYWNGKSECLHGQWYRGAIDMLTYVARALRSFEAQLNVLDRWRTQCVPQIMTKLGQIETAVHVRIFGHL